MLGLENRIVSEHVKYLQRVRGRGDFVPFTSEKMGKLKLLYRKKWPEIEKVVKTEQIKKKNKPTLLKSLRKKTAF